MNKGSTGLITSEKQIYWVTKITGKGGITAISFRTGWQMICYLSNINAEAKNN